MKGKHFVEMFHDTTVNLVVHLIVNTSIGENASKKEKKIKKYHPAGEGAPQYMVYKAQYSH